MANGWLEHVNLTVGDPDRSSILLQDLCGWHERWRGPSQLGGRTIHVGSARDYIALYTHDRAAGPYPKGAPLNHVALVVEDLDEAERTVLAIRDCDPELQSAVMSSLSPRSRRIVEAELSSLGSATPAAMTDARRAIAGRALELAAQSQISLVTRNGGSPT